MFTLESGSWANDASEKAQVMFCEDSYYNLAKLDCFVWTVSNPGNSNTVTAYIWLQKDRNSLPTLNNSKPFDE
jgi:hypothetical protein